MNNNKRIEQIRKDIKLLKNLKAGEVMTIHHGFAYARLVEYLVDMAESKTSQITEEHTHNEKTERVKKLTDKSSRSLIRKLNSGWEINIINGTDSIEIKSPMEYDGIRNTYIIGSGTAYMLAGVLKLAADNLDPSYIGGPRRRHDD